jgi:hypothetical protein
MKLSLPGAIAGLIAGIGLWLIAAAGLGYKYALLISFATIVANNGFQSIRTMIREKYFDPAKRDDVISGTQDVNQKQK